MSDYNQTTFAVLIVILATGIVGSLIGILWWRTMSGGRLDKDTMLFSVKLFMGIALAGIIVTIPGPYVIRVT